MCPMCPGCNQSASAAPTYTSFARMSSLVRSTLCLHKEKVRVMTTLITKLLTNPLTQSGGNEGRRRASVRLRASALNRPTVDGMEAVRDSSLAAPEIQPRRLTREAHARGRCLDG